MAPSDRLSPRGGVDVLGLERRLPVALDDSLDKTMRDDRDSPIHCRPLCFPAVHADTVVHLFEFVCIRVDGRLPSLAHRFCLPPMLVLSDPLGEQACSVGVHGAKTFFRLAAASRTRQTWPMT
jgi:hypothetical protein